MDIKKDLEKYWDNFVDGYSQIQQNPSIFGMQLVNFMKLEDSESILDAGCGPGMMIPNLIMRKQNHSKLISIDISEKILEAARQTVQKYFNNMNLELNWSCQKDDVEQLSFQNETFDRYYCNQVIHLVPDPKQALREAYRVLKPSGILGFSVWGRRQYSDYFTVPSECLKQAGIQMQNNHDSFALGQNKQSLEEMLEEIGFRNQIIWYSSIAYDRLTVNDYLSYQNPANLAIIDADPEKKQLFQKLYQQKIDEKVMKKEPFYHECLLVVCQK